MKVPFTNFGVQTIGAIHYLVENWRNTEPIPEIPEPKPKIEAKKTVKFDRKTKPPAKETEEKKKEEESKVAEG